jgi:hypothetical protein
VEIDRDHGASRNAVIKNTKREEIKKLKSIAVKLD